MVELLITVTGLQAYLFENLWINGWIAFVIRYDLKNNNMIETMFDRFVQR